MYVCKIVNDKSPDLAGGKKQAKAETKAKAGTKAKAKAEAKARGF